MAEIDGGINKMEELRAVGAVGLRLRLSFSAEGPSASGEVLVSTVPISLGWALVLVALTTAASIAGDAIPVSTYTLLRTLFFDRCAHHRMGRADERPGDYLSFPSLERWRS